MNRRGLKRKTSDEDSGGYWISFSDLMAGVLIIFMLLFIYKILDVQQTIETKEQVIDELSNTRANIISMLQEEFKKENIEIKIDPKTGAIQLDEAILFDYGQNTLKPQGAEFIGRFMPIYVKILLGKEDIKSQVSEIVIEGHTDSEGGYTYNLKLSQERAFNVANYMVSGLGDYNYKDELQNYLSANGKSYSQMIKNENGEINKEASRRVEIKFRLNEEETLLEIKRELEKGIN